MTTGLFHYGNGRRARPGDPVRLHSGATTATILSLWFDPDDGTDATLAFDTPRIPLKRVNLASHVRPLARRAS